MASLTADMIAKISNFRQATIDAFTTDIGNSEAVDALSSDGALSLVRVRTELAVTGTDAYTLAAPTTVGQRKIITCTLAASIPAATLTISSPDTTTGFACPATFFFDVVGQEIELVATSGLLWRCVRVRRAGNGTVTVGTTAITNKLWHRYTLNSTGTVASTLPSGTVMGEQVHLVTGTQGLAGAGTIDGAFNGGASTAYTHIGVFDTIGSTTVVGDSCLLEWSGAAWFVLHQTGLTLS